MKKPQSQTSENAKKTFEYPQTSDSNEMARTAREAVNRMSDKEAEEQAQAAMARIYGNGSHGKAI